MKSIEVLLCENTNTALLVILQIRNCWSACRQVRKSRASHISHSGAKYHPHLSTALQGFRGLFLRAVVQISCQWQYIIGACDFRTAERAKAKHNPPRLPPRCCAGRSTAWSPSSSERRCGKFESETTGCAKRKHTNGRAQWQHLSQRRP